MIAGRTYQADGAGRVVLAERVPAGTFVDILAPGFLDRQTLVRSASEVQFTLWPRNGPTGLDPDLTQRLVYWPTAPSGLIRLGDMTPRLVLVPSGDLSVDAGAMTAIQGAAREFGAVTGGRVIFEVGSAGGNAVQATLVIDPSLASGGLAGSETRGFEIIGGRVAFASLNSARRLNVVAHELGHLYGLGHSTSSDDLMYPVALGRTDFSAREKLLMNLMLQRRPGNQFPDNDRSLRASSESGTLTVYCPLE